jgi:predicted ATP-binding protein involved in virulence
LPEPAHPTWNQLINGSMDVQWVEIQGVVTTMSSNQISLLMPEGILQVWFEAQNQPQVSAH